MNNFGFNLLSATQSVIGKQDYQLEAWQGTVENDRGYEVDTYADAVDRKASVQPLTAEKAQRMGLELNSFYIQIFDVDLIGLLSRSENPDRIIWGGYYWLPIPSNADWNTQGGWNSVTAVRDKAVQ